MREGMEGELDDTENVGAGEEVMDRRWVDRVSFMEFEDE